MMEKISKRIIHGTVVTLKIKDFNLGGCQQTTFKTSRAWKVTSGARTKKWTSVNNIQDKPCVEGDFRSTYKKLNHLPNKKL